MCESLPIAVLFVESSGVYFNLKNVDPWDEKRNAMLYSGPFPVVAHPPCARWCRLASLVEARWGYKKGDDGGMFKFALEIVRKYGGVLEHPAYSDAWKTFDLQRPPFRGGWIRADLYGGFTCHVEQGHYGHKAKKATWLYAVNCKLPELIWKSSANNKSKATVSWCGNKVSKGMMGRKRISKKEANKTPSQFRDILISMARSCYKKGDKEK
jgi:hypothetical protein